jgi:hypothetical protein
MLIKKEKNTVIKTDCIIIGAGIFGLYVASILVKRGKRVAVIEKSLKPFSRASSINQARVHNGYHYPRSYATAKKVANYYNRFTKDFDFAINDSFKQIYAIANKGSKTSAEKFIDFCKEVDIPLREINSNIYFKKNSVEASFLAKECSFDFLKIKNYLLREVEDSVMFFYGTSIDFVYIDNSSYVLTLTNGKKLESPLVINAAYSGINEVIEKFNQNLFEIKYELCEVAFCRVSENFRNIGITVMDGNFFSVMPFGNNKLHTLTSVSHTPHQVCYDKIPKFSNEIKESVCKMHKAKNCIVCFRGLSSAWEKMYKLSQQFLNFKMNYKYSQFEIKPILTRSENDDSRPTIIKQHTSKPTVISILSGKLSTIYDLEKVLDQLDNIS